MIESKFWKYSLYAVILFSLQFVLFDHMVLWSQMGIVPYVYILLILLLPLETDRNLMVLIGFFFGLAIDFGEGTLGLHAAATTAAAFVRYFILNGIQPRHGYDVNTPLSFYSYGFRWTALYFLLVIVIHQFMFFLLADFNLSLILIVKVLLNSVYTFIIAFLVHILLLKNKV